MFKKITTASILLFLLFISPKLVNAQAEAVEGVVTKIIEEDGNYQRIEVTSNEKKLIIENGLFETSQNIKYKVNDQVVVTDGMITDYVRRPALIYLFTIFVILTVLVAGKWGLSSIGGMAYSFYIIFVFILPMIIKGYDAVITAIVGSMFIIPVTFVLSHGLNRKTINAMVGTFVSMTIVGLLSIIFVKASHLTGFAAEESGFLQYQLGEAINLKGILLAGIIISTLGVMDDITVSQSSVVSELRSANPKLGDRELFIRSMRVGKDHIASLVNTLVLVYTGASLPLLLLFVNNPHPFLEIINYEIVAEEIVRTLVGSIGLVLAVPITSFIAAYNTLKVKGS